MGCSARSGRPMGSRNETSQADQTTVLQAGLACKVHFRTWPGSSALVTAADLKVPSAGLTEHSYQFKDSQAGMLGILLQTVDVDLALHKVRRPSRCSSRSAPDTAVWPSKLREGSGRVSLE